MDHALIDVDVKNGNVSLSGTVGSLAEKMRAIGLYLNIVFVVIEAAYGVVAGSLALVADAGHNLSDVLSLSLAWGAILLAKKSPYQKRTYGFRKVTEGGSFTGKRKRICDFLH